MNWKCISTVLSLNSVNSFRIITARRFFQYVPFNEKSPSRIWSYQFRYIFAQRCRRMQQILTFYNRLLDGTGFKQFPKLFKFKTLKKPKESACLLGAIGTCVFDWNNERISWNLVDKYLNEIGLTDNRSESLLCKNCTKKIEKCVCIRNSNYSATNNLYHNNCKDSKIWEPYLNRDEIIIWRKEEKPAHYSYKVYAKYDDISSYDFLHVQTDIEYRKKWDDTVASLEIVESDPLDKLKSHVIYWETRWPKLFANRDYVYCRRVFIDQTNKSIIICNKNTSHPKCPIYAEKQRVQEYWSYMVIKPFTAFHEPGLEYVLIYFDDPGLAIPSALSSWIAQKQMPDFLCKLYHATKEFSKQKKTKNIMYNKS